VAPRSDWKGYLKLSLLSCSIAIYPATSSNEKISFNRLNRKTGNRIKLQNKSRQRQTFIAELPRRNFVGDGGLAKRVVV